MTWEAYARCEECNKQIDQGELTVCEYCYQKLLDIIKDLEEQLKEAQNAN